MVEEEQEEVMECGDCGEEAGARRPRIRRGPGEPSRAEIEEREVTHCPYRSWCPECVKARGKASPHPSHKPAEERGVATVSMDYWFMRDGRGEVKTTVVVMKDDETRAFAAHVVPQKGSEGLIGKLLAKDIDDFGHSKKVRIKCDQENPSRTS